jgi:MOSC domain-containing protein YiiM
MMESTETLFQTLPQVGRLEWIGLRPERMADLQSVNEVQVIAERGLAGDHKVAGRLHRDRVPPALTRRNLVVSGINLLALKDKRFRIGPVLLEFSGPCEPCSRMEYNLGAGGFNAMRGHGGITAKVIEGGLIRVGDEVRAGELEARPLT